MEKNFCFKIISNLNKHALLKLILLSFIIITINSQNLCNLKIADTMMSSFNGNDIIYNFGKIDEIRFSKSASSPYTAPLAKEIDYFYVTEIHGQDIKKAHENVVSII